MLVPRIQCLAGCPAEGFSFPLAIVWNPTPVSCHMGLCVGQLRTQQLALLSCKGRESASKMSYNPMKNNHGSHSHCCSYCLKVSHRKKTVRKAWEDKELLQIPTWSYVPCFRPFSPTHQANFGEGVEPDWEQVPVPIHHPTPSHTHLATQLTGEKQIRIIHRMGLIQYLSKGVDDHGRDGS